MPRKQKVAVSLSAEVLALLGRHAHGRSRSQCIEDELLRALRAREWDLLASRMTPEDAEEMGAWADHALGATEDPSRADPARALRKEPAARRRRSASRRRRP